MGMKITFGKYKNQLLSKVYEDTNYKTWLLKQQFFKNQYSDEYQYLLNYKPLSKINFTDLPCDIKSLIYSINYNRDPKKLQYDYEKKNRITKNGKKCRKQIVSKCVENCDSYYADTPRFSYTDELRYINCANCGASKSYNGGGYNNQQCYECCSDCYNSFKIARAEREEAAFQRQEKLQNSFCLISDSEDEE